MKERVRILTDKIISGGLLDGEELEFILNAPEEDVCYLTQKAVETRTAVYGKEVFIRGLIEITNYCKNDCRYCGIRASNDRAERYRLSAQEIIDCANTGYDLGFRTVVLQSGEDLSYSDEAICEIVRAIKNNHPDLAITLSIGEKEKKSYQKYFAAGAERYLLRQETSNPEHYAYLHPASLSLAHRKQCLEDLKEIGYQVGCGIMVGSPHQTYDHIIEDLYYMKDFHPHMVGIGPFIAHKDTPFKNEPNGTLEDTLHLLGIIRLMLPHVLLPATTALGTIDPLGREKGILAGANVVMPNLSPASVRKKYMLYDNKLSDGAESAQAKAALEQRMNAIGYTVTVARGDISKKQID
jgi:biotin synthase